MEKFLLILLFFHLSSSVEHSLVFFSIGFSGIPDFPVFVGNVEVDGIEVSYCDSDETIKPKQHWVKTLMDNDPGHVDWYKGLCFKNQPQLFGKMMKDLMQAFSQSEGVHVLQRISGCKWDDETGKVDGFVKYAYDGEDILSFDVKSLTWEAQKPEAVSLQLNWNADKTRLKFDVNNLIKVFPEWLRMYLDKGKSSLQRKVVPSVSLLQKSPSSPVTCHATGFFPDRAVMFWRRDGEELQEDVDHGEILPNHDGTFQMSVDLLKPPAEDWRSYDCVFQLSGVKDIISKFHKDEPKFGSKRKRGLFFICCCCCLSAEDPTAVAVSASVGLLLLLIVNVAGCGFMFYRQRKGIYRRGTPNPENNIDEPAIPLRARPGP
ncbi:major histocompatibility complex class I-related protein 1-like [Halichoeres trimaculatus]|uniref:major histocompatibility complex class I-related protein 1-like n=1 Tax=Halichoeres trimaculatus TaxID=147232 RepID=UPI003D9E5EAB